ncbi:MAG: protein kinase [Planctomycetota bacterium]
MQASHFIGPYAVVRKLGEGGMGVVYEVQDPGAPRTLALKLLREEYADQNDLARFGREIEALERVHHRGVVRIHATGRAPEGPYLVQELVEGQDLDRVAQQGVEPREAARIVREVACAVAAVHLAGILHRDLKPANVILRPDGIPTLLDFGLARSDTAEKLTRTGTMLGTPSFMSPEQAGGEPTTPATDVYGLGAVLYALLTDSRPFDGTPLEVVKDLLTVDPPWPRALRPEVPAELDAIVRHAMAKDPAQRYASAADLREDLDTFLAGRRPVAADVVGLSAGSSRGPLVAALVLGALLLVGGAAFALTRPPAGDDDAASPTPTADDEPEPSRTPLAPRDERLWKLADETPVAFDLALSWSQELEKREEGSQNLTFVVSLAGRAHGGPSEPLLLETLVQRVRVEMGTGSLAQTSRGATSYDTADADPKHALYPLHAVLKTPLSIRLDRTTGALVSLSGLDASLPAFKQALPDENLVFDIFVKNASLGRSVKKLLLKIFRDDYVRGVVAALSHVKGAGRPLPWAHNRSSYLLTGAAERAFVPLQEDLGAAPQFTCTGDARFDRDGLARASVKQRRKTPSGSVVELEWAWIAAR